MATAELRFADVTRAVVAAAAGLAGEVERRVVGDDNVRTARGNAWAALCADRARAQARADMAAMVAALAAARGRSSTGERTPGDTRDRVAVRRRSGPRDQGSAQPQAAGSRRGGQRAVGSSPRSRASQAALVSTR